MAKKSLEDRKPIIWGCLPRPRRETGAGGASLHPCGGFSVTRLWVLLIFPSGMKNNYYGLVAVVILVAGAIWWQSQQGPLHQQECATKLSSFEKDVTAKQERQNHEDPLAPSYANGDIIAPKVYDFLIGYSPKLQTCIGGYTLATSELVDTSSDLHTFYYHYSIVNLNTNEHIIGYDTTFALGDHYAALKNLPKIQQIDAAGMYASQDYKSKLSELTQGQIK